MELRHLRYFVAVAEELHFTRAAERLHMAQPPLSQQIRQLERELQVELFVRSRRRVQLTGAGRSILDDARRVIAEADRMAEKARRLKEGEAGELHIGFSSSAPYTVFPMILRNFRSRFPGVVLHLHERSTEEQIELLMRGAIDLAFARLPVENVPRNLILRTVLREPLVVALPENHPLGKRKKVAVRALAREPFVLFPRHAATGLYDTIDALCRAAGFKPRVAQEAVQMQTIVSLVSAGLGIAIVPASISNLHRERVRYRPLNPGNAITEMAVAYDKDNPSMVLRSFLAVVSSASERK